VRITTHSPGWMAPCLASQALMPSTVSRKSWSAAASFEQSMTLTGPTKFLTGMVSVAPSG